MREESKTTKRRPQHKIEGERSIHLFTTVVCGASGGVAKGNWKDVTCKRCLKKRPRRKS